MAVAGWGGREDGVAMGVKGLPPPSSIVLVASSGAGLDTQAMYEG